MSVIIGKLVIALVLITVENATNRRQCRCRVLDKVRKSTLYQNSKTSNPGAQSSYSEDQYLVQVINTYHESVEHDGKHEFQGLTKVVKPEDIIKILED